MALRLFGGNSSGDEESLVGGISSEEESKKRKRSAEELLPRKKIKISAVTPPEDIEMASVSPPTEPTAPGPAVQSPIHVPGPNNVPVLVPVAEPNMIFNAHVINLRVYNAGHNVLRQQAALHFGPPAAQHEEEAAPPSTNRVGVAAVDVGVAAADVGVAAAADVGGAVVHELFFLRSTCVIDGSVKSIFVFLLE